MAPISDIGFTTSTVDGIKIAAKDIGGPITTLSFVIKAGSRYSSTPGVAHALQRFAFQNTAERSGLRLTRESELQGATLTSTLGRDSIVLTARFLREDLPYFLEALSDVFARPNLARHELAEIVMPLMKLDTVTASKDALYLATEAAHSTAFRKGLGLPLLAQAYDSISASTIATYKEAVYTKANLAVIASGASLESVASLVPGYLQDVTAGSAIESSVSFFGGDARVSTPAGNAAAIAFPTTPSPEVAVVSAILGGASSIKWSSGSSLLGAATGGKATSRVLSYANADLFTISVSAGSVSEVATTSKAAVDALKSIASGVTEDTLKKGVAAAKFGVLSSLEGTSGLAKIGSSLLTSGSIPSASSIISAFDGVSASKVKSAAEALLNGKKVYATAGNVSELPYSDEIGL
ncbi:Metalloenzyme, LuxS/M16 peptidase-like protein [Dipodascopsis uninucleata]